VVCVFFSYIAKYTRIYSSGHMAKPDKGSGAFHVSITSSVLHPSEKFYKENARVKNLKMRQVFIAFKLLWERNKDRVGGRKRVGVVATRNTCTLPQLTGPKVAT